MCTLLKGWDLWEAGHLEGPCSKKSWTYMIGNIKGLQTNIQTWEFSCMVESEEMGVTSKRKTREKEKKQRAEN